MLVDADALVGLTEYYEHEGRRIFTHTEVDPAWEGQGLVSRLVRHALDQERAEGRRIVPMCPFVRAWIERHPDYDDLVDHDMLAAYIRRSHG